MEEKRYRSVIKAASWRLTGTIDTFIVSYLVTGQIKLAIGISFFEVFTKLGLYYLHERLWLRIPIGKVRKEPDYEI